MKPPVRRPEIEPCVAMSVPDTVIAAATVVACRVTLEVVSGAPGAALNAAGSPETFVDGRAEPPPPHAASVSVSTRAYAELAKRVKLIALQQSAPHDCEKRAGAGSLLSLDTASLTFTGRAHEWSSDGQAPVQSTRDTRNSY